MQPNGQGLFIARVVFLPGEAWLSYIYKTVHVCLMQTFEFIILVSCFLLQLEKGDFLRDDIKLRIAETE